MQISIRRQAAPLVMLLIFLSFTAFIMIQLSIAQSPPTPPLPTATPNGTAWIVHTKQQRRSMQTLYHIEAEANKQGWTNELYRQAGNIWYEMGDLSRALPYWEALVSNTEDNDLLRQMADSYIRLQRWSQAQTTLKQLLELDPDDRWTNYMLGLILAPSHPGEAVQYLEKVQDDRLYQDILQSFLFYLYEDYDAGDLPLQVGWGMGDAGLWDFAERAFQHAADINYPHPQALASSALARQQQGKDGTLRLEEAIRLAPADATVRYLEGNYYRSRGDYVRSLEAFQQAARLDPDNPRLYVEISEVYQLVENFEQAQYWLEYAVDLSNHAPEYEDLLAALYAEKAYRTPAAILDTLGQTSRDRPEDPSILSAYGWALHTTGESEAGLRQIEQALTIDPELPRALYDKARILLETDAIQEAIPLFEQIAASDSPYTLEAQRILDTLES